MAAFRNSTGLGTALGQFKFNMSYVFNSKLTSTLTAPDLTDININRLHPSSEVVMMTEKIANSGEYLDKTVQNWVNANSTVYYSTGKINAQGSNTNVAQSKADWTRFTTRHNHGGHLLFGDGHVDRFAWTRRSIHGQ